MLWVTTKCNMSCKYCYEGKEKSGKNMSVEIADKAIDFTLKHYQKLNLDVPLVVGFHGGEPLLQYELIKYIIERFKNYFRDTNKKLHFSMTTNGILLNEEISDYLCKNIKFLSISLDGTKQTNDTNRVLNNGEGTYDIVFDKFISLLKKKPDIRVRSTFNTLTVNNLYEDVKHLINFGFRTIVPVPDLFINEWDKQHMEVLYKEMQKIRDFLETTDKSAEIKVGIIDDVFEIRPKGVCSGGLTGAHIDPEGNIYPCTYTVEHEEFIIGHVDTGTIEQKVNKIFELSKTENDDCKGCQRYRYCNGTRCKIVNKIMTGDYHKPPVALCAFENVKYSFLKNCKCN